MSLHYCTPIFEMSSIFLYLSANQTLDFRHQTPDYFTWGIDP